MSDDASKRPKRTRLSLSSSPARRRAPSSADTQVAIPLPDLSVKELPTPVAEDEPRIGIAEPTGTLIGAEDAAAHDGLAPANEELVRAKLGVVGPPLRRRRWFSDKADRVLFLVFAIGGFAGIFSAKLLALSGSWVASAAVGALILYALVSWSLPVFRSNPDRLGDNCYYMGFLFTLASLSAALVALQNSAANGRVDLLEALIGGFGIALFSTIAGITLRVFFMQMRREIEDLEEQLRTELQRSARLLTDQLARAVIDLENFRIRTESVLNQRTDEAARGFSGVAEKLVAYVETAGSAYGQASGRLAENAERVAANMDRLVDRVERIDVPSDLLTRQVDDARGRIEALATALEGAMDAGSARQTTLDGSARALDALIERLSDIGRYADIERSAGAFAATMELTGAKVAKVGDDMAAYASAMGGAAARIERDREAIAMARELIDRDLVESSGALHKLQSALADVADGLVKRVAAPAPGVTPEPVAVGS